MNSLEFDQEKRLTGASILADLRRLFQTETSLVIAGLGDSLTYGWMVEKGFFNRFVDRLKELHPSCEMRSINAGVPGDTADGGLYRLDKLLKQKPHMVIVEFGLNDMCCDITEDEFQSTLESIVRRILKARAHPVLVTSCPLPWEEGARAASSFFDRIRAAAKETDVPCASLDLYWRQIAGPPSQWDDLLQEDNVHPTDKGHALMAEGLMETLVYGNG